MGDWTEAELNAWIDNERSTDWAFDLNWRRARADITGQTERKNIDRLSRR